eukprot:m.136407 g.136407  ORF g.136407 m.136407 type:complete len:58 (+) comp17571_c0_seq37:324-497(+)
MRTQKDADRREYSHRYSVVFQSHKHKMNNGSLSRCSKLKLHRCNKCTETLVEICYHQ